MININREKKRPDDLNPPGEWNMGVRYLRFKLPHQVWGVWGSGLQVSGMAGCFYYFFYYFPSLVGQVFLYSSEKKKTLGNTEGKTELAKKIESTGG